MLILALQAKPYKLSFLYKILVWKKPPKKQTFTETGLRRNAGSRTISNLYGEQVGWCHDLPPHVNSYLNEVL